MAQVCKREAAAASIGNCSALRKCLQRAVAESRLPPWEKSPAPVLRSAAQSTATAAAAASTSLALAMWFLFFFVVRHSIGHTLVMIPYDALGQELTSDSESRQVCPRSCGYPRPLASVSRHRLIPPQQLFAWKSIFNFMGMSTSYMLQLSTAALIATDISAQARVSAAVGACLMLVSAGWLLAVVRERPTPETSGSEKSVPFLATMYALAKNRPYRNCKCR